MDVVASKHGVPIRLTDERWQHIITEHAELGDSCEDVLNTIADPERILAGNDEEQLAVREIEVGKWMIVVYRESDADGFIITAFWTRRHQSLDKRTVLWSP